MTLRFENEPNLRQITACVAIGLVLLAMPALLSAQTHAHSASRPADWSPARLAFERFKKLEGGWKGRSTKGWAEDVSYKTIAAGSVVVGTSFDAHPNETMLSLIDLDGDRLMLTHYCVAKNQPRLVATSFADEGKTITFTFLDGTNLPSRDRGHMDKAVFRFVDENHVTSKWTWY